MATEQQKRVARCLTTCPSCGSQLADIFATQTQTDEKVCDVCEWESSDPVPQEED